MCPLLPNHNFLVSGANDFNHNNDDCYIRKCKSIAKECQDHLYSFCSQFPQSKVTMAPIPMRNICKESKMIHRFPEYGSPTWIQTTNQAISLLQDYFSISPCHSNQATFLISPPFQIWEPLLSPDGLHLNAKGKRKMIFRLLCT